MLNYLPQPFPSLLAFTPSNSESNFEIFNTFSMGMIGIMTPEVVPITTSTNQIYSSSTLPVTIFGAITLSTNNEWVSIPPSPSSFGNNVETYTPREGGGSSRGDHVVGSNEEEEEEDASGDQKDLDAIPTHYISTPEMEISVVPIKLEVENTVPPIVPDIHPLRRV